MDLADILKAVAISHTNTNHEHDHGIYPTRTRLFSDILITACLAPSSSSRGLFLEFELCRIVLILLSLRITIHELDPRGTSLWFLSSCLCLLKKRWQLSRRQTRITNTIMVRPPNSRRF